MYRTLNNEDTYNNYSELVNLYGTYIDELNIVDVLDSRLMSYSEAVKLGCSDINSCPKFANNQMYNLGSAEIYRSQEYITFLSIYMMDGSISYGSHLNYGTGVRPIIVVPENQIGNIVDLESQLSFELNDDMYVKPSYSPNKNTKYTVLHKKQKEDETGYVISNEEVFYAISDDYVTPSTRNYNNFISPEPQTVFIKGDGTTTVEYLYDKDHYTIWLNPNGGTVNIESQNVPKGSSITLPTPVLSGYSFLGWYDSAEGGNLIVSKGESYTPDASITLYAHWEVNNNPIAYLTDLDNDLDISLGDKVTIGEDEFYFIGKDDNGNLKLLAKYNLDSNYRQSENSYVSLKFSDTNYWVGAGSSSSSSGSGSSSSYIFNIDSNGYEYVYRTSDDLFTENNLTYYVNNYKVYITSETEIDVIDARLMSYEEASVTGCLSYDEGSSDYIDSCPIWVANQRYWLGSVDGSSVWFVNTSEHYLDKNYYGTDHGVRPVIIVSESDISMPWENNNTLLYSDTNNDGNISLGDIVRIGSERFRVIDEPSNGEVKLLAMYNLNSTPRQSVNYDTIVYSSSNYWNNSSDYTPFGSSSYNYIYRTTANRFITDGDTNNNLKTRINSYKDYLNGLNIVTVSDARLMSYEEALATECSDSCPEWVANQPYWLGSVSYNNLVWYVYDSNGGLGNGYYSSDNNCGIRPVITISESDIPTA